MLVSSNTCRFCLILVDKENVPLFYNDSPKKVMDIADVQVSEGDGLPNVICPSCFAQLELSHQFKLQVEKADKILREENSVNAVLPDLSQGLDRKGDEFGRTQPQEEHRSDSYQKTGFPFDRDALGSSHVTLIKFDDEAGETENMTNEENVINTRHVCGTEVKITHQDDLNSEPNSFDNNTLEKTNSMKQNQKDTPTKDSETYECEVCHASFEFSRLLNFHRVMLHMHHKCKKCVKVFSSKTELENHRRIHLNERLTCTVCGKVYKTSGGVYFHMKACHAKNRCSLICEICGKSYCTISALKIHKESHVEGRKPVTCKLCNKTLPHALALKSHKRWVHLVAPPFHCDVCNKIFKHPQHLKKHKQRHSLERTHVCRICGSAFPWKSHLKTHMKVHTGVEPYCCQHCGQPFKRKQPYDKHVLKCLDKQSNDDVESTGTSTTTD